jgi:hypothetical protein
MPPHIKTPDDCAGGRLALKRCFFVEYPLSVEATSIAFLEAWMANGKKLMFNIANDHLPILRSKVDCGGQG